MTRDPLPVLTPQTVSLILLGQPYSKANSRQVVKFGDRTAMIKSPEARAYERSALKQIPPAARLRMEGELRVTLHIYYTSERPDLDESLILDVLQDRYARLKGRQAQMVPAHQRRVLVQSGVYRNDRQVREKHVYWHIDPHHPRAEITIEQIKVPPQLDLLLSSAPPCSISSLSAF